MVVLVLYSLAPYQEGKSTTPPSSLYSKIVQEVPEIFENKMFKSQRMYLYVVSGTIASREIKTSKITKSNFFPIQVLSYSGPHKLASP